MAKVAADGRAAARTADRYATIAAAIALLVFLPSLAAGYVYDDVLLIAENPHAQSAEHLFRGFRTHLWDVHAFGSAGIGLRYYRPLVTVSYVLNWLGSGGEAWAFHLVNTIAHAMATFLAVRIATRWTGHATLGLLAGLVFALHPSRTESVIWIAGRTDIFMALFTLLSVELSVLAARASVRRAAALGASAVAALVLAILSKEGAAMTALLLVPDLLLAARGSAERRRLIALCTLLGLLGVGYLGARFVFYPVRPEASFELTPSYGLFTVWAYAERVLFPWPMTFFYRPAEASGGEPYFAPHWLALGALAAAAYLAVVVRALRHDRVAAVLLVAAAGTIAPLLNFTYTHIYVTTSDHFLYLTLLPFVAGLLRMWGGAASSALGLRPVRLALGGVLVTYAAIDIVRVGDYRSDETLFQHELEVQPDNPVALAALSRLAARDGDLERASLLIDRALSPPAQRFFLLSGNDELRASWKSRKLALDAVRTPDGDAARLEQLYEQMDALLHGRRSLELDIVLDDATFLLSLGRYPVLASMAADTALLGTRLGRVARANELVRAIPDERLPELTNALNFVLTVARLGDFPRARRLLERAAAPAPGTGASVPAEAHRDLAGRLERAERLFRGARAAPGRKARIDTALALAELGAFLPALRLLRPVFDGEPSSQEVGPLYVQLLLSARLEAEALEVATRVLGAEAARAIITSYTQGLPPRIRELPRAPEPSSWWPG